MKGYAIYNAFATVIDSERQRHETFAREVAETMDGLPAALERLLKNERVRGGIEDGSVMVEVYRTIQNKGLQMMI